MHDLVMHLEETTGQHLRDCRGAASINLEAAADAAGMKVQEPLDCETGKRRAAAIDLKRPRRLNDVATADLFHRLLV